MKMLHVFFMFVYSLGFCICMCDYKLHTTRVGGHRDIRLRRSVVISVG